MKKCFAVLAISLSAAAGAQTPAVLIEACNAIADSSKRLECLKAAMGAGGASAQPQPQPLPIVMRAFSNMEASLNAGISYNNYQVAVLDLAKAVAAFKQDAKELEAAGKLFDAAVEAYSDAGTFWAKSIEFYARRDNSISYAGGLPVSMNGLGWLESKYNLTTVKSDIFGIERGLPVQATRTELWRIAQLKTSQGKLAANPKTKDELVSALSRPYPPIGDAPESATTKQMMIDAGCSADPFVAMWENGDTRKVFSARCDSGQSLRVVCTEGYCKGNFTN